MGGTKSKVDGTPDEESDTSKTSESTNTSTEYTQENDERPRGKYQREKEWQGRRPGSAGPDKILDKPFRYRSRRDRLLESLNAEAGDSTDSYNKSGKGKVSVQKIVETIQANLNVKSVSSSSITGIKNHKASKNVPSNDSNSHGSVEKKVRRSKPSPKTSSGGVKPTGDEEKIIESLIQPRKRRCSLPRSIKIKSSGESVNVHSNPVEVSFENRVNKDIPKPPTPPKLPPVDFSDGSCEEEEIRKPQKRTSSMEKPQEEKPLEPTMSRTIPSHLKELKLRFSNNVPRSPHEDNLNSTPITEKSQPRKSEKPLKRRESAQSNSYFTNNVPVADSLHILTEKPGSPKVVIRGAKDQDKRSHGHKTKLTKFNEGERNLDSNLNTDNASEISKKAAQSRPTSSRRSILKNNHNDDAIKCFPVKTEYNEEITDLTKSTHSRKKCRDHHKQQCESQVKTARTQTSNLELVDSGVQTLPDLEPHARLIRKDSDVNYDSAIDSKARKVLRRVSMDRSVDRRTSKGKRGRRYRNGSTQWEEVDLLDNSSCLMLNGNPMNLPVPPTKSSSWAQVEERNRACRTESSDCQDCYNGNEVCCMHLQVIPDSSMNRRAAGRKSRPRKKVGSERLSKHELKDHTRGDTDKNCEGCSCSGRSSSDKVSAWATYSTSSGRERELSLLSPVPSTFTVQTKSSHLSKGNAGNKSEDLYRQMEELGLGFLRDGEWVPTDVISRTLWENLEKCTENCQATWKRRSRSLTHT